MAAQQLVSVHPPPAPHHVPRRAPDAHSLPVPARGCATAVDHKLNVCFKPPFHSLARVLARAAVTFAYLRNVDDVLSSHVPFSLHAPEAGACIPRRDSEILRPVRLRQLANGKGWPLVQTPPILVLGKSDGLAPGHKIQASSLDCTQPGIIQSFAEATTLQATLRVRRLHRVSTLRAGKKCWERSW
jgi:hypothetical protein